MQHGKFIYKQYFKCKRQVTAFTFSSLSYHVYFLWNYNKQKWKDCQRVEQLKQAFEIWPTVQEVNRIVQVNYML